MNRLRHTSRRTLALGAILAVGVLAAIGGIVLSLNGDDAVIPVVTDNATRYVEGVAGSWQRINPLFASENAVDADLSRLLFSGLVKLAPDGSVEPDMAELPEISEGGRVYTFQLKPNLRWHDGVPVTSGDVAFTISQLQKSDFKGSPDLAAGWAGVQVETPDTGTVILRTESVNAPFLARYATVGILPMHSFNAPDGTQMFDSPFNAAPVGTGPFRLAELTNISARLDAYPDYHLGRPNIDHFEVRFFSDYPSAQRALRSDEIDGVLLREVLTPGELADAESIDGIDMISIQSAAYLVLYLNNDQSFFADEQVREAISLALDRDAIAEVVFSGLATPSSSPIAPGTWAYDAASDETEPDLDQARQLLEDAGWVTHPTTGNLSREGSEFRITLRTDNDPTRRALGEEVASQLGALGIRATVASTTFAVLRRDFLEERRYDAAIAGWDQGADPDPYSGWHSSQTGVAGRNIANYGDVIADSLIAQGRTNASAALRTDAYSQLQQIWSEESPSVIIAYPDTLYLRDSSYDAPDPGVLFTPADRFNQVHEWQP